MSISTDLTSASVQNVKIEHFAEQVPKDLPSLDDIARLCKTAGFHDGNGLCIHTEGFPRYWVKYGDLTIGEGLTQDYVARIVNVDPSSTFRVPEVFVIFSIGWCRHIVMEFVSGKTVADRKSLTTGEYQEADVKAAVSAVKQLIELRVPAGTPPGPIGGGTIGHDFFVECRSDVKYPKVEHLHRQIKHLAKYRGIMDVQFGKEAQEDLVLCPSDLNAANFLVDESGRLWVIDFGRTCFMPRSFLSYSLNKSYDPFTRLVQSVVQYPEHPNLKAMVAAAGILTISGRNTVGLPSELL